MPWSSKFKTGSLAGILLAILIAALAGCDEDDSESKSPPAPNPPGEGSLESPYIIQYDDAYTDIPLAAGGVAWILAENVPVGWTVAQTDSPEDIDLSVFGFKGFLGNDNPAGSYTADSGAESLTALGDGESTDLFMMVDGTFARADDTTFDVSVAAGEAPADVTVTLGACTVTTPGPPPAQACESPFFGGTEDVDLPFVMGSQAALAVSLSNTAGDWVFYVASDSQGSAIDFTTNEPASYGAGYCDVNNGSTTDIGTCVLNPNSNGNPPRRITVANNSATVGVSAALSFASP